MHTDHHDSGFCLNCHLSALNGEALRIAIEKWRPLRDLAKPEYRHIFDEILDNHSRRYEAERQKLN